MKKIFFILIFSICMGSIVQAQFLQKLKAKTVTAADAAKDKTADKTVDKVVTQTSDKATDKILDKTSETINRLFKKKNKKKDESEQAVKPEIDSAAIISNSEPKPEDSTIRKKE